jgi:hypothetical protein
MVLLAAWSLDRRGDRAVSAVAGGRNGAGNEDRTRDLKITNLISTCFHECQSFLIQSLTYTTTVKVSREKCPSCYRFLLPAGNKNTPE